MQYMLLFWVYFCAFLLLYFYSEYAKNGRSKHLFDRYSYFFLAIFAVLLAMAILTDDPVELFGISVPVEMQWLASLIVFAFLAWHFYLNPLKIKVYGMDKELGEVRASLGHIEKSTERLLDLAIDAMKAQPKKR
ncbi:MAG: hypothetical protein V1822_03685 [Candidatus Micrarchaeota archaeon]